VFLFDLSALFHSNNNNKNVPDMKLDDLRKFIALKCYVVTIITKDPTYKDAFQIFGILNERGKPITPVDQLKSQLLSKLQSAERSEKGKIWQRLQFRYNSVIGEKGDAAFNSLFQDILVPVLATHYGIDSYKDHLSKVFETILAKAEGSDLGDKVMRFFNNFFEPYAEVYLWMKMDDILLENSDKEEEVIEEDEIEASQYVRLSYPNKTIALWLTLLGLFPDHISLEILPVVTTFLVVNKRRRFSDKVIQNFFQLVFVHTLASHFVYSSKVNSNQVVTNDAYFLFSINKLTRDRQWKRLIAWLINNPRATEEELLAKLLVNGDQLYELQTILREKKKLDASKSKSKNSRLFIVLWIFFHEALVHIEEQSSTHPKYRLEGLIRAIHDFRTRGPKSCIKLGTIHDWLGGEVDGRRKAQEKIGNYFIKCAQISKSNKLPALVERCIKALDSNKFSITTTAGLKGWLTRTASSAAEKKNNNSKKDKKQPDKRGDVIVEGRTREFLSSISLDATEKTEEGPPNKKLKRDYSNAAQYEDDDEDEDDDNEDDDDGDDDGEVMVMNLSHGKNYDNTKHLW